MYYKVIVHVVMTNGIEHNKVFRWYDDATRFVQHLADNDEELPKLVEMRLDKS